MPRRDNARSIRSHIPRALALTSSGVTPTRARVGVTPELVKARARGMWERMLRALSRRGISPEGYAQISGRSEPQTLADLEPEAEQALRREAVLTAIVAAEGVTI